MNPVNSRGDHQGLNSQRYHLHLPWWWRTNTKLSCRSAEGPTGSARLTRYLVLANCWLIFVVRSGNGCGKPCDSPILVLSQTFCPGCVLLQMRDTEGGRSLQSLWRPRHRIVLHHFFCILLDTGCNLAIFQWVRQEGSPLLWEEPQVVVKDRVKIVCVCACVCVSVWLWPNIVSSHRGRARGRCGSVHMVKACGSFVAQPVRKQREVDCHP